MEKQTAVRETLLKEFANCSDKLFTLGIIRTDSFTGEIGEFIASKYFKLSLAGKSTKAYDGVCPKGYKYQIKSKVISNNNLTHHISNLKYQDFDYLVVVYFVQAILFNSVKIVSAFGEYIVLAQCDVFFLFAHGYHFNDETLCVVLVVL